jgi:tetratricopeptide (TPR) repeat protein
MALKKCSGIVALAFGSSLLLISAQAVAQFSQSRSWCENRNGAFSPEVAIKGCDTVISSGKVSEGDLALSHYNRGRAYVSKQDYGRAITDFTDAIRLDPNYSLAYFGRASVYSDKKDYDHAIALDRSWRELRVRLHRTGSKVWLCSRLLWKPARQGARLLRLARRQVLVPNGQIALARFNFACAFAEPWRGLALMTRLFAPPASSN